jgi:acetyl esterase/lipase
MRAQQDGETGLRWTRPGLGALRQRRLGRPSADGLRRDIADKAWTDSVYRAVTRGVVDFQKIKYKSRIGDMEIPAYVFQPLVKRGARGHAAMVWVHGGVHGNWDVGAWPFVREAVERGYVIIAPEYRGSTGYGATHHNAIDSADTRWMTMSAYDWSPPTCRTRSRHRDDGGHAATSRSFRSHGTSNLQGRRRHRA